jgi:4-amino-4-deoxy-L-arabinose transferase-like glycosyltransferase
MTAAADPQRRAWAVPLCAFLLPIVLLAPFANKAYHLDDPLSLWTAQHILKDPIRFYDYPVNWTGVEGPAYLVIKNPPLSMYYMAAVGEIFGFGEVPMHLAFLLPAALASLGTYFVARRFCQHPLLAAACATLTPAILVSASNVMTAVTMIAFYVWAVATWLRGLETNRAGWFVFSGVLMTAAALSQYFGASTVPLLLAYTLLRRQRPGAWIAALAIPVLALVAYQLITKQLFGVGLFLDAGNYATVYRSSESTALGLRILLGVVYTGGCIWTALWFAPFYGRRVSFAVIAVGLIAAIAGWILFATLLTASARESDAIARASVAAHFGVFVAAGLLTLGLAIYDLERARSPESALLVLWVFGAFAFAAIFNWTINARSLLGMAAPAAILAVRQLERARPGANLRATWAALAPMAATALMLVYADYTVANGARAAANDFHAKMPAGADRNVYFGHWGFQYYMEQGDARHFDLRGTHLAIGDMLILPDNNMRPFPVGEIYSHTYRTQFPVFPWATTWNYHDGAAYYSNTWGPFPYVFGQSTSERYAALVIDRDIDLKDPNVSAVDQK